MRLLINAKKYACDKDYRFLVNKAHGLYNHMPDEKYLCRLFKISLGYELNLDNPQTFNEKLQWLKLHDRKPIYTTMVDKHEAKKYVAGIIGEEYIIPTLGIWERFDDIDFDLLPNQFVLKCTHDSGGLVICRDKEKLDMNAAKKKITSSLKENYYFAFREWPYKNVKPRIIAEKYMEESDDGKKGMHILKDYKIYTFNGKAKVCMINQDRGIHTRADYFDEHFNWLDFTWGYDHADVKPEKPEYYEEMFQLAETLSKGTIELRVDFYQVNGKIYFGELTFFTNSGWMPFENDEWNLKLGDLININNLKGNNK